jgi:hypothetical protein
VITIRVGESVVPCCHGRVSTGEEMLREHGLRVTRPRLAVLEVLTGGGHLEVDEIAQRVRSRLDSVSTQAIYDVLGALTRAGLTRRIEPPAAPHGTSPGPGTTTTTSSAAAAGRSPTSTARWASDHV